MSSLVIEETLRNLQRKAPAASNYLGNLLQTLSVGIVDPPNALVIQCSELVHPKDAPIVAAAVAGSADVLASYDRKHLLAQALVIRDAFKIVVVTPSELLDIST
jgi:predicted nucleic acid-binding protein